MRSGREENLIWDSNGSLNNMFRYRSLKSKLSLICSHNCLRSKKTAVRKADLLVKRACLCFFSPRKALWPCLHLVQSSLKWIPQSSALAVCWFSLWAVSVSKALSSWRKQNCKLHLRYTQMHSRHWDWLKDHNQWLVLKVASNPMCDGARSPVWDWISSEAKPSELHTL